MGIADATMASPRDSAAFTSTRRELDLAVAHLSDVHVVGQGMASVSRADGPAPKAMIVFVGLALLEGSCGGAARGGSHLRKRRRMRAASGEWAASSMPWRHIRPSPIACFFFPAIHDSTSSDRADPAGSISIGPNSRLRKIRTLSRSTPSREHASALSEHRKSGSAERLPKRSRRTQPTF